MTLTYQTFTMTLQEVVAVAKILISMPDEFLANIDKVANDEYRTRSELIRAALRDYIAKQGITNPIKEKKKWQ